MGLSNLELSRRVGRGRGEGDGGVVGSLDGRTSYPYTHHSYSVSPPSDDLFLSSHLFTKIEREGEKTKGRQKGAIKGREGGREGEGVILSDVLLVREI